MPMRAIMVCCLALCLGLASFAEDGRTLRVLSYNIHHAEGKDGRLDLARIAAVIKETRPDVVCLQEVDRGLSRTDRLDMPAHFAELLGMTAIYEANYRFDGGEYGNCTLTALPIVDHANFALPGTKGNEPRGVLRVTLKIDGREIDVFNTHWALTPEERAQQGEALLTHLRPKVPTLVAGDFNEREQGAGVQALLTRLQDSLARTDRPAESCAVKMVIDHVFVSPGIKVLSSGQHRSPESEVASDHLPYLVEVRLPETQAPA